MNNKNKTQFKKERVCVYRARGAAGTEKLQGLGWHGD
jgi:hypothetical protein